MTDFLEKMVTFSYRTQWVGSIDTYWYLLITGTAVSILIDTLLYRYFPSLCLGWHFASLYGHQDQIQRTPSHGHFQKAVNINYCIVWHLVLRLYLNIQLSSLVMIQLNNAASCSDISNNLSHISMCAAFCSAVSTRGTNIEHTFYVLRSLCKIEWTDSWLISVWVTSSLVLLRILRASILIMYWLMEMVLMLTGLPSLLSSPTDFHPSQKHVTHFFTDTTAIVCILLTVNSYSRIFLCSLSCFTKNFMIILCSRFTFSI